MRIEDNEDAIVNNYEQCCNLVLIKDNNMNVCKTCGSVHSYDFLTPYIDFYENWYNSNENRYI